MTEASGPLILKTAISTYANTRALKENPVISDRLSLEYQDVRPTVAIFRRMVRGLEFDVAELAITTYIVARAHGRAFTALPIFLTRDFHHTGLVYRVGSGIQTPRDLVGHRVGVRAYTVTTGVWTRGILQSEYGLDLDAVTWVTDDEEHVQEFRPPPNVVAAPPGRSLVEMLRSGEIAAALSGAAGIGRAGPPTPNWTDISSPPAEPAAEPLPLIPDAQAREAEWFAQTGIYPIHGVVVVRDELLAHHPWLAEELFHAFSAARDTGLTRLEHSEPPGPDDVKLRRLQSIVGDRPLLPYGLEPNRPTIEALLSFAVDQKIITTQYAVEELFAAGSTRLSD
jgi:4,5-dihydroxyphthalate decarboxylase